MVLLKKSTIFFNLGVDKLPDLCYTKDAPKGKTGGRCALLYISLHLPRTCPPSAPVGHPQP